MPTDILDNEPIRYMNASPTVDTTPTVADTTTTGAIGTPVDTATAEYFNSLGIVPATGSAVQGPMIGNNLGPDAANLIDLGLTDIMSPEQIAAGQAYIAAQGGGNGTGATTTATTSKTVVSVNYLGSGASRVLRTTYSDGTYTDAPAPETPQGPTTDQVNTMINDALAKQQAAFEKMLADQAAAAAKAKLEQTQAQRKSAYEIIAERFTAMGVKDMGDAISQIFQGTATDRFGKKFDEIPTTSEGFYLQLIQTTPYYERFGKVNEERLAAGYRALDEKTIVGMEDEYQKVLQAYNMPAGFYDQPNDFRMFLKNNYRAVDVADVLQAYSDFTKSTNPTVRGQLKDLYGISDSDLTAYFIDQTRGQSILENIAGKNMNTAAALIEGLSKEQADIAQTYGAGSLSYGEQRQKYSRVQQSIQTTGGLAAIYGENFGAKEAIAAEFGNDVQAQQLANRIQATNLAEFQQGSGVGAKALRTKTV